MIFAVPVLGGVFGAWCCYTVGRDIMKPAYSWLAWLMAIKGLFIGAEAAIYLYKHMTGMA